MWLICRCDFRDMSYTCHLLDMSLKILLRGFYKYKNVDYAEDSNLSISGCLYHSSKWYISKKYHASLSTIDYKETKDNK